MRIIEPACVHLSMLLILKLLRIDLRAMEVAESLIGMEWYLEISDQSLDTYNFFLVKIGGILALVLTLLKC